MIARLAAVLALAGPAAATAQVLVPPARVADLLGQRDVVVLHAAMDRADYERGHIPGARFAPVMSFHAHGSALPAPGVIAAELGALGVANDARVVVVGAPMDAALLYVALDYVGHGERTVVLDGGLTAWKKSRRPVSTEPNVPKPARFVARPNPDLTVDAAWIEARRGDPRTALVDARTRAEYVGGSTNGATRSPGHIPGAGHLDWVATLNLVDSSGAAAHGPPPDAELREPEALQRLFRAAGVSAGDTVVAYCTVGMRASHLYLTARHLGWPARLYVGSMADWTADARRPVQSGGAP